MSADPTRFYNPYSDVREKINRLTLLDQPGVYQFVTFHTADSIPIEKQQELMWIKNEFLKKKPQPWNEPTIREYRMLISEKTEKLLDDGYGRCLLKHSYLRDIVDNAIIYYHDHQKWHVMGYVIMPNHVHLLVYMLEGYDIEKVLYDLKRFTATEINKKIGEKGKFWIINNYCRMIRNQKHFDNTIDYIKRNPQFLKEGEFTLRGELM